MRYGSTKLEICLEEEILQALLDWFRQYIMTHQ